MTAKAAVFFASLSWFCAVLAIGIWMGSWSHPLGLFSFLVGWFVYTSLHDPRLDPPNDIGGSTRS